MGRGGGHVIGKIRDEEGEGGRCKERVHIGRGVIISDGMGG